jgi:hypothetical protein
MRTGRETFASSGSSRTKAPRERSRFHNGLRRAATTACVVTVTTTRVIVRGTPYALLNITSVRTTYTPRKALEAILLLIFGLLLLLVDFMSIHGNAPRL